MSLAYDTFDRPRYRPASGFSGDFRQPQVKATPPQNVFGELKVRSTLTKSTYTASAEPVDELSEYELYDFPDWDANGALPITGDTIGTARRLKRLLPSTLMPPHIAPGNDGTIGFEWRTGAKGASTITFIEVGPGDMVSAARFYPTGVTTRWPRNPFGWNVYDFIRTVFPGHESA